MRYSSPRVGTFVKTNFFLIVGDPFLRKQKSKSIAAEFEKKVGGPVTLQILNLEETPLGTILTAARTLPFFSQGQIFSIQGAETLKEADLDPLRAYFERPMAQTVLVFEADELRSDAGLFKLARAQGQVVTLVKEDARGAGAVFLQQKLKSFQKTITPGAKTRLLDMCGDMVVFLDTMLDRLIQYSGPKTEIDEAMVAQFEENWTEMDVFKLTNAFLARDPARILKVFRDLMDFYEADLISLIGIIHWQLRQLWQAAVLLEKGASERDVCSRCKMPPARISVLKKFPTRTLEAALEALYQIDKKSKTGLAEGVSAVEAWLLQYTAL